FMTVSHIFNPCGTTRVRPALRVSRACGHLFVLTTILRPLRKTRKEQFGAFPSPTGTARIPNGIGGPQRTETQMKDQNSKMAKAEEKVKEEFTELAWVFSYLALYFCAVATYSMLLLNKFEVRYFTYGAALINALVLSKVILIGEAAHLGKRSENRPLIVSA